MLLELLETKPPHDISRAREWFGILANHISSMPCAFGSLSLSAHLFVVFSAADLKYLSQLHIVPVKRGCEDTQDDRTNFLKPSECYIGDAPLAPYRSKIFAFVDFGLEANRFLNACGSKDEPSVEDIAGNLLANPNKFYSSTGDPEMLLYSLLDIYIYISNEAPFLV